MTGTLGRYAEHGFCGAGRLAQSALLYGADKTNQAPAFISNDMHQHHLISLLALFQLTAKDIYQ